MHKIIIKNTSIVIENYKIHECPQVENYFTLYDKLTHTRYTKGIEYVKERERLIIPRGVNIYNLESKFGCNAQLNTICDRYDYIDKNVKIKYLPRDDRQKEALKFMLGKERYHNNEFKSQFAINLPTGFGKTYCSIATMAYLNIKSMVITSSIDWLRQWKKCVMEYTNIKKDEIYLLSGKGSINIILNNKKRRDRCKIILASHNTIKSYGDSEGWDKVTELFKVLRIGLKFYDEAHLNFDNICKIDFWTNTYKTYYLTATPARSDSDENKIYQMYFKNIPSIDMFDQEEDAHVNYISMRYSSHPSAIETSKCKNMYGLNRSAYISYLTKKDIYHDMLIIALDMMLKHEGKILIFIGTNKAILETKSWLEQEFPPLKGHIGVYTSIITEDKEKQLDNKIILSTTKSCGAAKDIKGLKFTVVLAEPFNSKVIAKQSLGRCRDKNTYYIDMVDIGFKIINRWFHAKQTIFNKYALSKSDIMFTDDKIKNKVNKILNEIEELRKINMIDMFYTPTSVDMFYKSAPENMFRYNMPTTKYKL